MEVGNMGGNADTENVTRQVRHDRQLTKHSTGILAKRTPATV